MFRRGGSLTIFLALALSIATSACVSSNADVDETERDDSGEVVEGGEVGVQRLRVGDCLDVPDDAAGDTSQEVDTLAAIPCEEPHTGEVVFVDDRHFDDVDTFPGADEALESATPTCIDALDSYTNTDYDTSVFEVFVLVPTQDSWDLIDDRGLVCIGGTLDEGFTEVLSTTGSIRAD